MSQTTTDVAAPPRAAGRLWLWLGILAAVGGIAATFVQFGVLKWLSVPWYAAALLTVGALCAAAAFAVRKSVTRGVVLTLLVFLAGFVWYGLAVAMKLPEYAGPAREGSPVPTFTARLTDGQPFSDADLRAGQPSVLVFYRGHW